MARKVITTVELTDDLDGSKADATVGFTFDGVSYEIDLSKRNLTALNKVMKPYVEAARRVRSTRRASGTRGKSRDDVSAIREWAKSNRYDISDRGRIPASVMDAYDGR
jgi:hypothetical protein